MMLSDVPIELRLGLSLRFSWYVVVVGCTDSAPLGLGLGFLFVKNSDRFCEWVGLTMGVLCSTRDSGVCVACRVPSFSLV